MLFDDSRLFQNSEAPSNVDNHDNALTSPDSLRVNDPASP